MKNKILTCVFLFMCISFVDAEIGSKSFYWAAARSSPKDAFREVLNTLNDRDYNNFYALVSMNVVSSVNRAIIRYENKIWGVDINLRDILISNYGIRYGKIAVFEAVISELSTSKKSWVYIVQNKFGEEDKVLDRSVQRTSSDKITEAIFDVDDFSFYFVYSEGKWFLDNVKGESLAWIDANQADPMESDQ